MLMYSNLMLCLHMLIQSVQLTPLSKGVKHNQDSRCDENEVYTTCRTCEASCDDIEPDCPLVCESEGCECQHSKGFVRHLGKCVPVKICDSLNITTPIFPSCENTTCPAFQLCKMKEIACLTKECFPQPECVGILDVVFPD